MSEILLTDRDLPTGSGTYIRGAQEAMQNVVEAITTPYGSLPWDREAGSRVWLLLNDLVDPPLVVAEIRRAAGRLRGIVKSTLRVVYLEGQDSYRVTFVPYGDRNSVALNLPAQSLAP